MECLPKPVPQYDAATDIEIIMNLKTVGINKRKAEDKLFARFYYFILLKQHKGLLTHEELVDAYTDSMLAVINAIIFGGFKNRSSLKTFVYEVYHNKCVDRLRKKTTHKSVVHRTESLARMQGVLTDTSLSAIEKLMNQSDLARIRQQMSYLSENCRNALLLSLHGYSDKEIASIVKFKTPDVAKTSRLRSIKKLRQLVL